MYQGRRHMNQRPPLRQHEADQIVLWLSRNRGILTRIARACQPPVTPQFVHQVLRHKRNSEGGVVERMLREQGAPLL